MRNQGAAGWADRTGDFPFVKGAVTGAGKLRVDARQQGFRPGRVLPRPRAGAVSRSARRPLHSARRFKGNRLPNARTQVDADFDGDGRMDRARIDAGRQRASAAQPRAISRRTGSAFS